MSNIEFEISGTLAVIRLPDSIEVTRVFLRSKRIELVLESDNVHATVSDTSGVPRLRKRKAE
jgi:hypothetical protein